MIVKSRLFEDGLLIQETIQEYAIEEYIKILKYQDKVKKQIKIEGLKDIIGTINVN